jgi:hypothetical protein
VFRETLLDPTPRGANPRRPVAVTINEWLAKNNGSERDPADRAADDWFELYNAEATAVDLGGWYLTDDLGNPTKYHIPTNGQYRIPAGGYLLVWADDQVNQNRADRADLHVNFKLDGSAGVIGLVAPDGQTPIDTIAYAQQTTDVTEGRYGDGAGARYFMTRPTPRSRNAAQGINSPPAFPPVANQVMSPGQTLTLNVRANDPETPLQSLTYAIDSAPPNAAINQSGLFRWIVPTNQPPGDYPVILRVTDNGVPPRSDTVTFTFTVLGPTVVAGVPRPVIQSIAGPAGQVTFTIETIPGRTYRVWYAADPAAPSWTQLDRDFVAANSYASLTDFIVSPQRFYRVQQVD